MSLLGISTLGRLWSTTGDLESNYKPIKKSVKFGNAVHLVLIPTREEYCGAGLAEHMWWDSDDYVSFKDAAVSEIRSLMLVDDRIDCKTAQVILYQPPNKTTSEIKYRLKSNYRLEVHFEEKEISSKHINFESTDKVSGDHKINTESIEYKSISNEQDITYMKGGSQSNSIMPKDIKPIVITHIKSQVDLTKLDQMGSINTKDNEDNLNRAECMKSDEHKLPEMGPSHGRHQSNIMTTNNDTYSPIKKSNKRNIKPISTFNNGESISNAMATVRQPAIHPLAYICS